MTDSRKISWIISPTFPPAICGVGDHTNKLVRELSKQLPGWQWHIITTSPQVTGQPPTSLLPENGPVKVEARITTWKGPLFKQQWQELLQSAQPSLVFVQYTPHLYDRLGVNLDICRVVRQLTLQGVPVYLFTHELYVPFNHMLKNWVTGPTQRWMMRQMILNTKGIFVNTRHRERLLKSHYPKQQSQLHFLPVTTNIDICSGGDPASIKAQWCQLPEEHLLLFWGKLHSSKMLPLTLGALETLKISKIPFQAVYIGPDIGVLNDMLTSDFANIWENVHATGPLPEDQVSGYLQATDLLLYPLDDGASTQRGALMAALQHGTPVVTTVGHATDDEIRQCPNMYFATSYEDFISLTLKLVQQPTIRSSQLSQAMQAFFETHYSWSRIVASLIQTIKTDLQLDLLHDNQQQLVP